MGATKVQELEALKRIREIIADLGGIDSCVGMALEGCFEIAEDNIKNDFGCSMKQRADQAYADAEYFQKTAEELSNALKKAKKEIDCLTEQLDRELEWRDYEMKENVRQDDYDKLVKQSDTRFLTDEEAKDILYDWYGFAKEKLAIQKTVPVYQINRHCQMRQIGEIERRPVYNVTDWNYIRFDCGAASYELYNDSLRLL